VVKLDPKLRSSFDAAPRFAFRHFTTHVGSAGYHHVAASTHHRKQRLEINRIARTGTARGDGVVQHERNMRPARNFDRRRLGTEWQWRAQPCALVKRCLAAQEPRSSWVGVTDGAGVAEGAGTFCAGGIGPPSCAHVGAERVNTKNRATRHESPMRNVLFINFPSKRQGRDSHPEMRPAQSRCLQGKSQRCRLDHINFVWRAPLRLSRGLTSATSPPVVATGTSKTRPCMNTGTPPLPARFVRTAESILANEADLGGFTRCVSDWRTSLRHKTLLIVLAALIGLVGGLYVLSRAVLLSGFSRLEAAFAAENLGRASSALSNEIDTLQQTTDQFADSDQTYAYLRGSNPEGVRAEFPARTFEQSAREFHRHPGRLRQEVFSKGFNVVAMSSAPVPDDLDLHLARDLRCLAVRRHQRRDRNRDARFPARS